MEILFIFLFVFTFILFIFFLKIHILLLYILSFISRYYIFVLCTIYMHVFGSLFCGHIATTSLFLSLLLLLLMEILTFGNCVVLEFWPINFDLRSFSPKDFLLLFLLHLAKFNFCFNYFGRKITNIYKKCKVTFFSFSRFVTKYKL